MNGPLPGPHAVRALAPAAVLLLGGCAIELSALAAGEYLDAGPTDARFGVDARDARDAAFPSDDAAVMDASSRPDAEPAPRCDPTPDTDTIALYRFDGDEGTGELSDATGRHSGTVEVPGLVWVDGPEGCGRAIAFANTGSYGVIPDSRDWDLAVGSVDFWLRVDDALPAPNPNLESATRGVVSRDASGTAQPGHFTIYVAPDGTLTARVQTRTANVIVCSTDPVPARVWVHVGLNIGMPRVELWVDGVRGLGTHGMTMNFGFSSVTWVCGTDESPYTLEGNDEPWTVGVSSGHSAPGQSTPNSNAFVNGAVDHLRISRARRDFARR